MVKPKYRVAGRRPGARDWYSETTFSISHAFTLLKVARESASGGQAFWIEQFRNNRWERFGGQGR